MLNLFVAFSSKLNVLKHLEDFCEHMFSLLLYFSPTDPLEHFTACKLWGFWGGWEYWVIPCVQSYCVLPLYVHLVLKVEHWALLRREFLLFCYHLSLFLSVVPLRDKCLCLCTQTCSFSDQFASIVHGKSHLVLMEKLGLCSSLKFRSWGLFPVFILSSNVEVFLFSRFSLHCAYFWFCWDNSLARFEGNGRCEYKMKKKSEWQSIYKHPK